MSHLTINLKRLRLHAHIQQLHDDAVNVQLTFNLVADASRAFEEVNKVKISIFLLGCPRDHRAVKEIRENIYYKYMRC